MPELLCDPYTCLVASESCPIQGNFTVNLSVVNVVGMVTVPSPQNGSKAVFEVFGIMVTHNPMQHSDSTNLFGHARRASSVAEYGL